MGKAILTERNEERGTYQEKIWIGHSFAEIEIGMWQNFNGNLINSKIINLYLAGE